MAGYFKPEALDDPDVCGLSDNAHRAWLVLCIQNNPRCGIFKLNWRQWAARSRTPFSKLPSCMEEYKKLGWVRVDDENGYIWIVSYTKHQSKQKFWLAGAFDEAKALSSKTSLAVEFMEHYADIKPDISANSNLKSIQKSGLVSDLISASTGQDITVQDSTVPPTPLTEPPPADATEAERLLLAEMENWKTCKTGYADKLKQIRKLAVKFPRLDLLDVAEKLTVWDSEQPPSKRTKNWLSRFGTFCENAEERRKSQPIFPGTSGPRYSNPPYTVKIENREEGEIAL